MPPLWAVAAMVILGFNEFMALLYNPLVLLLLIAVLLFGKTVYAELDIDAELEAGLLPGLLSIMHKFVPTLTLVRVYKRQLCNRLPSILLLADPESVCSKQRHLLLLGENFELYDRQDKFCCLVRRRIYELKRATSVTLCHLTCIRMLGLLFQQLLMLLGCCTTSGISPVLPEREVDMCTLVWQVARRTAQRLFQLAQEQDGSSTGSPQPSRLAATEAEQSSSGESVGTNGPGEVLRHRNTAHAGS